METAENIISKALEEIKAKPRYRNVKYMMFGENIMYYAGNKSILQTTLIAVLQERPSELAQPLSKCCLEQMRQRGATLIVSGDIVLAAKYAKDGGRVVLLLTCGIRNVKLGSLMPAIEAGNAIVLSLSEYEPSDNESVCTTNRLLAAFSYCGIVIECQGGAWNSKTNQWGNHIMRKCELLHGYGKSIFIAPWRKGHPAQHLVIKHEFGAVDLPEAEDPANIFSFIPEEIVE